MADKPKVAESGVLRACLDLLAAECLFHRRWNTGAIKADRRFFRFGKKGDADIQLLLRKGAYHLVCWIETKSSTGRQTDAQKEFQQEVESHGHQYLLVRDVSELQDWLKRNRT